MGKKLASFLEGDESNSSKGSGSIGNGALLNTSTVSRDLAKGQMKSINKVSGDKTGTKSPRAKNIDAHVKFTFALTRTYAIIMSRWEGGGYDIIGSSESHSTNKTHMDKADPFVTPFLNVLCFSTPFIRTAWPLHDLVDAKKSSTPIRTRMLHTSFTNGTPAFLLLGLAAFAHALIVTDDMELHELDYPFPTHQKDHARSYGHHQKQPQYSSSLQGNYYTGRGQQSRIINSDSAEEHDPANAFGGSCVRKTPLALLEGFEEFGIDDRIYTG